MATNRHSDRSTLALTGMRAGLVGWRRAKRDSDSGRRKRWLVSGVQSGRSRQGQFRYFFATVCAAAAPALGRRRGTWRQRIAASHTGTQSRVRYLPNRIKRVLELRFRRSRRSSMLKRLDGEIAVVTGADSGIGQAIACAFDREGADVLIVSTPTPPVRARRVSGPRPKEDERRSIRLTYATSAKSR